ncbi:hypothetical protein CF319_g8065 [Tilletia indica]|nr:hypothetical protein CF319_g8065 [Tilletia indica]
MGIKAVAINAETLKPKVNQSRNGQAPGTPSKVKVDWEDPVQMIESGAVQVVLTSPEILFNNARVNKAVCEGNWAERLRAIIVDEAHVVYDWGIVKSRKTSAFRPEFGKLAMLRAKFGSRIPLVAVSATLCGPCLPEICSALQIGRLPMFALDVGKERDGCVYDIQAFQHAASSFLDLVELLPSASSSSHQLPKMLVYVNSRIKAADGADVLRQHTPAELRGAIASFVATDSGRQKKLVMDGLRSGKIRIVVSTEALGMGIDLPDVDMVVQWELPVDFKSLVQHFGRGARGIDTQAKAVLVCSSWVLQCRDALRKSAPGATLTTGAAINAKILKQWESLDSNLRSWISDRGCLRTAMHDLLALKFSDIPTPKNQGPVKVSSEPIGLGPIAETTDHYVFWRNPSSIQQRSRKDQVAIACCSLCDSTNSAPRNTVDTSSVPAAPARLTAPPLAPQTTDLRRNLGCCLHTWRLDAYKHRRAMRNWQSERTIMSDAVMYSLIDRAPRVLAYVQFGGVIDFNYTMLLLGGSSCMREEHVKELQSLLSRWADTKKNSFVASQLTRAGWISKRAPRVNSSSQPGSDLPCNGSSVQFLNHTFGADFLVPSQPTFVPSLPFQQTSEVVTPTNRVPLQLSYLSHADLSFIHRVNPPARKYAKPVSKTSSPYLGRNMSFMSSSADGSASGSSSGGVDGDRPFFVFDVDLGERRFQTV